jgi:Uma2 family endonuclease
MYTHLTPEQYLELDRQAEFRSEYFLGELFPLAAPTWVHSSIVANVVRELSTHLRKRPDAICLGGIRVLVGNSCLQPDAIVICGKPEFLDGNHDTVLNPSVIVEVSRPENESADGAARLELYGSLPSLRECLLIATDRIGARVLTKQSELQWSLENAGSLDEILTIGSLGCALRLDDIYHKVEFSDAAVGVGYTRPLNP